MDKQVEYSRLMNQLLNELLFHQQYWNNEYEIEKETVRRLSRNIFTM
jgi:hypothetical protein